MDSNPGSVEQGIIEDPERKQLKLSAQKLKDQITDVLAEYEDIQLQQNPMLEADYAVKIGCYENEDLESYIAMRRAKRKYTLAQSQVNNGEPVDEKAIEAQLDQAFVEWEEKLQTTLEHYFALIDYRNSRVALSDADSKKLKTLFHKLVMRFHPDIQPQLGEEGSAMFQRVQAAYKAGDLETLEALEVTTSHSEELDADSLESIDELNVNILTLESMLSVFKARLAELKQSFPYCYAESLDKPAWVAARVQEIQERIALNTTIAGEYRTRFESLLGGSHE